MGILRLPPSMATVMRAAKRLQQPAVAGARQCSVLVNYNGAVAGKGPVEVAEQAHATTDWRKYSMGVSVAVAALMVVEGFIHLTHAHSHEPPTMYPFRKMRTKAFPWGNGQDSLFGAEIDSIEK